MDTVTIQVDCKIFVFNDLSTANFPVRKYCCFLMIILVS